MTLYSSLKNEKNILGSVDSMSLFFAVYEQACSLYFRNSVAKCRTELHTAGIATKIVGILYCRKLVPAETLKQSQVYYELRTLPRLGPTEAIFTRESQSFLCDALATRKRWEPRKSRLPRCVLKVGEALFFTNATPVDWSWLPSVSIEWAVDELFRTCA